MAKKKGARGKPLPAVMLDLIVGYWVSELVHVVAKLVPMDRKPKDSIFGWLRGQAWERGDIVAPIASPGEWEVLEEWDGLNAARPARRPRRRKGLGGKSK